MVNYKSFIEKAENALNFHSMSGSGHCFLFCTDIAEFQLINRYYGTEKGDALLGAIETYLEDVPEVVVFERIFSDQFIFIVVTPKAISGLQIGDLFNCYVKAFLTQQKEKFPYFNLKVSCGIYAMENNNFIDAIDGANMARKESKKNGSVVAAVYNYTILYEKLNYLKEEQNTNLALQEKRFVFFLQPKVNLLTGEIIGAEALARRIDQDGNIIFPDSFLKIMESCGSIVELDILIFEQVCEHIAVRLREGLPVVRTSVNLSRLHIQNADTAELLHSIAEKYAIPPDLIEFELTETILLNEFEGAKNLIDQLRGYQYHVSIDDFGAGYAGINIWQELNFDILKLDRRFLSDEEPVKSRNTAIVPNVINIAQRLGIDVICEGVETEEQCEYLLRLGCTAVQGFFFSRPIPKDEFYETYQKQQGQYQGYFKNRSELPRGQETDNNKKLEPHQKIFPFVLFTVCSVVFLAICVISTLGIHRNMVANMFTTLIEDNLDSYTLRQAVITHAKINDIKTTMDAFSTLIAEQKDPEFIDTYILALNKNNPDVTFLFSPAQEFEDRIKQGEAPPKDIEYINVLKSGESVISDIVFSEQAGNIYCFSIGVPVFINSEFIGGLRAVVNANLLTSVEQHISSYGKLEASFVVDQNGTILLPNEHFGIQEGANIFDDFEAYQLTNELKSKVQKALLTTDDILSFSIGKINENPYFISVSDLNYNGWKSFVIFKSDEAQAIISKLLHYTITSATILMFSILIVCVSFSCSIRKWKKKANSDIERYLLLEQFSDTVLFDYDCQKDIIRFTPNAAQLFRTQEWKHDRFLNYLTSVSNVYPADCSVIEAVLTGRPQDTKSEIRIRLKHPSDDRYYWCLVQYKYIYDKQKLKSVIGKIVDIDEQQKRESQLTGQALRDGLTHLYNKSTAQDLISQCMQKTASGFLFMMDVDNFKQLNDTFGHPAGDSTLRAVAECLKNAFRSNDIIGRAGGDELIVYMQQVNSHNLIHQKMTALWKLLYEYSQEHNLPLSISVGVAYFPDEGKCFEDLFEIADQAMYEAKRNGKQQYCFMNKCYSFDSMPKEDLKED